MKTILFSVILCFTVHISFAQNNSDTLRGTYWPVIGVVHSNHHSTVEMGDGDDRKGLIGFTFGAHHNKPIRSTGYTKGQQV